MKNLLELTTIVAVIVTFGALSWAAMGMMAGGNINPDEVARAERAVGATRALIVAGIAFVIYVAARLLRKRMS